MDITAIIVTYNSAAVVPGALEGLRACEGLARCIVVDNASTDGTVEAVLRAWPGAEIVKNPANLGFGRGNNTALAQVCTPFALLVNPDARIDNASLMALRAAAERYADAAIFSPQLADEAGNAHHNSYKKSVFLRERQAGKYIAPSGDLCAEFLSGAVWLVRMSALSRMGVFDPSIFLYYEDDDMCLRAREAGFSCVLVEQAKAVHMLGKSSAPNPAAERFRHRLMAWSRLYLQQKYKGRGAAKQLALRMLPQAACKWLLHVASPRRARYAGRISGIIQYLRGEA